jgi:hypothetical protein
MTKKCLGRTITYIINSNREKNNKANNGQTLERTYM